MEKEAYENEQERERENMTGFEKFQQKIKDGILAYLPEEYRDAAVEIVHVPGNNDQEQTAMTIKREGQEMAARVFLDVMQGSRTGFRMRPFYRQLPEII